MTNARRAELDRDEEQEAFDNMPEGLQQADRGAKMEEAVSAMDEIFNAMADQLGDNEQDPIAVIALVWWFIENVTDADYMRNEMYFRLRSIVREATNPEVKS